MKLQALIAASLVISTGLMAGPAHAVEKLRTVKQNAPAICGAVDPADDVYLRRYPPSLYNAKPGPVQVICQLPSVDANGPGISSGGLSIKNNTGVSGTVACTAATGYTISGVTYKYKEASFAPGAHNFMTWDASDFSPDDFDMLGVSCTLPRGFAVHLLYFHYTEDVGL
jgi:hypothetical protein